ncbi:hypothetical protein AAY473_031572 [Plecturocebus cupreus]
MLARLVLNSWPQVIYLRQPPVVLPSKCWDYGVSTTPGLEVIYVLCIQTSGSAIPSDHLFCYLCQCSSMSREIAKTTGARHHAQVISVFLVEIEFCHVGQAGLELWTSGDLPASASRNAGITDLGAKGRPFTCRGPSSCTIDTGQRKVEVDEMGSWSLGKTEGREQKDLLPDQKIHKISIMEGQYCSEVPTHLLAPGSFPLTCPAGNSKARAPWQLGKQEWHDRGHRSLIITASGPGAVETRGCQLVVRRQLIHDIVGECDLKQFGMGRKNVPQSSNTDPINTSCILLPCVNTCGLQEWGRKEGGGMSAVIREEAEMIKVNVS